MQGIGSRVDNECKEGVGFCKPHARFVVPPVIGAGPNPLGGGAMKGRLQVSAACAVAAAAFTVAACGGDDGGGGGNTAAKDATAKLSDKPMELTFLWFEWPPAQALEELGNEYTKTRPNVTVKVNTVPNPQWHDAIFTQFAARKTNFDIPVLDSQNIGEAVENGSILDLMGETPPATWEDMIAAAKKCQDENEGMSGLAFHQAGTGDAAGVTYNVMNALYGGELWNQGDKKIDGVVNNAAGQKAMDVLVNKMVPLAPKGSSNWFIDEVNAAISQGQVCVGFQWVAAMGGLTDPASSELGK